MGAWDQRVNVTGAASISGLYCEGLQYAPGCGGTPYTASQTGDGSTYIIFSFGGATRYPTRLYVTGVKSGGGNFGCTLACGTHPDTVTLDASTCSFGDPAPTYYGKGCVTNNSSFVVSFFVKYSDGTSDSSAPLGPGGTWCVSKTNSTPLTYQIGRIVYDSDMGTNFFYISDPQSLWTNNPTPTPGTAEYQGPYIPTNNVVQMGGNNSGNLTGQQYASGVTNIINNLYNGFQMLGAGLAKSSGGGQTGPGITNDYTGVLNSIRTNTQGALGSLGQVATNTGNLTNLLSQIVTNTGTNLMYSAMTNLMGNATNTVTGEGNSLSNTWAAANNGADALGPGATNDLHSATDPADFWVIPGFYKTSARADADKVSLKPTNYSLFNEITKWIKIAFIWIITITTIQYIRFTTQAQLANIMLVPGGSPGKGTWSFISWFSSKSTQTLTLAAAFPIVTAIMTTVLTYWGSDFVSPFSNAGVNTVGAGYNYAIGVGFNVIKQAFPLYFFLSCFTWCWLYDTVLFSYFMSTAWVHKQVGN